MSSRPGNETRELSSLERWIAALKERLIDPMGKIPEFKFCACRIEKVSDTEPAKEKADAAE